MKPRRPILLKDIPCWPTDGIPGLTGEEICIQLTKGCLSIVDAAEIESISAWNWRARVQKDQIYAVRATPRDLSGKQKTILLHRQLLQPLPNQDVDHRDQHRFFGFGVVDNRRQNLRIVSTSQNSANQRKRPGYSSRFKGVSWDKRNEKWKAQIKVNGRTIHLGRFDSELDAASAYDAAHELHFPGIMEGRNQQMFPQDFSCQV